jgi:RHS repeat-associated protein
LGYYFDSDLSQYSMGGKPYSPALGRFTTPDLVNLNHSNILRKPIALVELNPYEYSHNSPANLQDRISSQPRAVHTPARPAAVRPRICEISLHSWPALGYLPLHHGLTITYSDPADPTKTKTVWLDGGNHGLCSVIHVRPSQPSHSGYNEEPPYAKDYQCCQKMLAYAFRFSNACVLYNFASCNSNWGLKCLTRACNYEYLWTTKPVGYDCLVCTKWIRLPVDEFGVCQYVCVQKTPYPCPRDVRA